MLLKTKQYFSTTKHWLLILQEYQSQCAWTSSKNLKNSILYLLVRSEDKNHLSNKNYAKISIRHCKKTKIICMLINSTILTNECSMSKGCVNC